MIGQPIFFMEISAEPHPSASRNVKDVPATFALRRWHTRRFTLRSILARFLAIQSFRVCLSCQLTAELSMSTSGIKI